METHKGAPARIPSHLALNAKASKCPDCKEKLAAPALVAEEQVVRAVCAKDGCGYTVDVMWVGSAIRNQN